ncbi:MAG: ATP-binding protein [Pseudomonadota bacterium]
MSLTFRTYMKKSSLGSRLLAYILLFSFFFTLAETGVQLYLEYQNDINFIEKQIQQIQNSYLKSIINSSWDFDTEALQIQLEGAQQLRDIQYLVVKTEQGDILASSGHIPEGSVIDRHIPLEYMHHNETNRIGELYVIAGLKGVHQRLYDRVLIILSSRAVKTFFMSLFILLIFQYLVSRHLGTMALYARNLDIEHMDIPLELNRTSSKANRDDELAQVVKAVNDMRLRIHDEITERKEVENKIRLLRNYLTNVINSMPSVLVGIDPAGTVTQWNRQAEIKTGVSSKEASGKKLNDVFPRMAVDAQKIQKALLTQVPQEETKIARQVDGEKIYENITIYPLTSNGTSGAVIRIDDVTEQVRLEEMMVQTEKMASIGGLAAGMAHEINNPLAGILGNAQMLRLRLLEPSKKNIQTALDHSISFENLCQYLEKRELPKMIDNINTSGLRAARIVRNMLSFCRKSGEQFKLNSLPELLDNTLELITNDYDLKKKCDFKKIKIIRKYDDNLPLVYCENNEIQQVFFNLFKNAAEAMAEKEYINESPFFIIRLKSKNDTAFIEIEDNGPGMEDSVRKRVLEPFFTTKSVGMGTGLGLSVSYFIITEQHGGAMEVVSSPGKGTNFLIRLPISGSTKGSPKELRQNIHLETHDNF